MHRLPGRFFADLGSNIVAALLTLVFQRSALRWLRAAPEQFAALLLLSLCSSVAFDVISEGWPGSLAPVGFAVYLLPPFSMTVFGLWLGQRYSAWRLGFAPVIVWLAADALLGTAQCLVQLGGQRGWWPEQALQWVPTAYTFLFVWPLSATVILFGRALAWRWWQTGAAVAVMFLLFFGWSLTFSNERLWQSFQESPEELPSSRITEEEVWTRQPQLLENALASLKPQRPGKVDWYFVGVGGAYYQSVFRRETESVRALFDTRFGTDGRSLVLINSDDTVESQPIATRSNLLRALQTVAARMDPAEDVLFLFMTSHGSENHEFEMNYWPLQLEPVTPDWLREALDDAGIKRRVIVISACYSGGFIPGLKTPDSLVMTASSASNTSFGCSDDADFTYFGRALFDESLRHQHSLLEAFDEARSTLLEREQAEGFSPSDPQVFVGDSIRAALPKLEASLFPPR